MANNLAHKINIDTSVLHPLLQHKLSIFLDRCEKQGYYLIITEGFRTVAEQNEKVKQGYSKALGTTYSSMHQWYVAFDFALNFDVDGDGKVVDDVYNDSKGHFAKIAKIAKSVGLEWGGDWKSFVDKPHLQLSGYGSTPYKLKQMYGSPDIFKKTFTKKVTYQAGKSIRLFKEKSLLSKVLERIPNGKTVDVLISKSWWSKVKYNGKIGYCRIKYLK